ncbi:hypothetical protein ALP94_01043 [Pseudomonas savastanoi pv. glycinea]|uniref:hypothetical protein n=1 Tax=Pseudomonas TaxID=286 RepID=UPI000F411FFA|nr:hypothetical protein [Pseudomonas syringae]RMR00457.1 hypothetical protein ALP94_01043 [Pseudomonas savastanoi pv. glycinea]
MSYRLLNSSLDPHRMISMSGVPRDLQQCLRTCIERISSAESIMELCHAHGRALGLSTGLGVAEAITGAQFNALGVAFERAFEDRLVSLKEQLPPVINSNQLDS